MSTSVARGGGHARHRDTTPRQHAGWTPADMFAVIAVLIGVALIGLTILYGTAVLARAALDHIAQPVTAVAVTTVGAA